jgi:hypothetical protein
MRSRSRQATRLTFHPIVIASAIVFTVLFLALGYHTGVNHVEQAHQPRMLKVNKELVQQRSLLSKCESQVSSVLKEVAKTDSRAKALARALRELKKDQSAAQSTYNALDRESAKCEMDRVEMEFRIRNLTDQDEQKRRTVEEIEKEVDALQVSILRVTHGEGMSIVLLNEVVKSLRAAYETKCRALPGCVELTDEDLLKLHVDDNRTEEEIKAFLVRDAVAQKSLANSLARPSADLSGIYFLPSIKEERQWDAKAHYPTYFHRSITQNPLRGAKTNSTAVVIHGNVASMMEMYGDYAMCAYHHNNSQFSFQSPFVYTPEGTPVDPSSPPKGLAYLHKLIVSPVLQYCTQCDAHLWAKSYGIACFKDRMFELGNYGTYGFWRVRSMIQAAPEVQNAALNYYVSRDIEQQNVLAVVLHLASERDREECDRATTREYGIHYQYLVANFPDDAALKVHVAAEREAQCSPTPAQIIDHISNVCKASGKRVDKIYLSVSAETRSDVVVLLKESGNTELLDRLLPAFTDPEKEARTPGFTELVDLEIASRASTILISPFMRASRYVTEEFLLRHHLNPSELVWVF